MAGTGHHSAPCAMQTASQLRCATRQRETADETWLHVGASSTLGASPHKQGPLQHDGRDEGSSSVGGQNGPQEQHRCQVVVVGQGMVQAHLRNRLPSQTAPLSHQGSALKGHYLQLFS